MIKKNLVSFVLFSALTSTAITGIVPVGAVTVMASEILPEEAVVLDSVNNVTLSEEYSHIDSSDPVVGGTVPIPNKEPTYTWDVSAAKNGSVYASWWQEEGTLYIFGNGTLSTRKMSGGENRISSYLEKLPSWKVYPEHATRVRIASGVKATGNALSGFFNGMPRIHYVQIENAQTLTKGATSLHNMFANCSELRSLKSGSFNTSNVTDLSGMFYNCRSLTEIDTSGWNTSNVTNMSNVFYGCNSVQALDVSRFNTSRVTSFEGMFSGCNTVRRLDVGNFSTARASHFASMFNGCRNVESLSIANFDVSRATNLANMFADCRKVKVLDVSRYNTSNVTRFSYMFSGCSSVTDLGTSAFNFSRAENLEGMFRDCSSLRHITTSNIVTSNATSMAYLFSGCSSLEELDVSHFETSKVSSMAYMFNGCKKLKTLNVGHFNTSRVTSMSYMFADLENITSLDVSKYDTSLVTDMSGMFKNLRNVSSVDTSHFNTSRVNYMQYMFSGCVKMKNINTSSFNTSNVYNVSFMFNDAGDRIDLSNFDLKKVTSSTQMLGVSRENVGKIHMEIITPMRVSSQFTTTLPVTLYDEKGTGYIAINSSTPTATVLHCKLVVTFNMNGGSYNGRSTYEKTGFLNTPLDYDEIVPVRTNYSFAGWYLDPDMKEKAELNGVIKEQITLYAGWIFEGYPITYKLYGGSMTDAKKRYKPEDSAFTIPNPTRKGYTFTGWTGANGDTPETDVTIEPSEMDGDIVFYAHWTTNHYTIHFDPNGGTGTMGDMDAEVTNRFYLNANKFSKTGYYFAGWNTKADGTGASYLNNAAVRDLSFDSGDVVTLYAQWTQTEETGRVLRGITAIYNGRDMAAGAKLKKDDFTVSARYFVSYSDNSNKTVVVDDIKDFTLTPDTMGDDISMVVTVSYTYGDITRSQNITIYGGDPVEEDRTLKNVDVTYDGKTLRAGKALNRMDFSVVATYTVALSDGSTSETRERLSWTDVEIKSDPMKEGVNDVVLQYTIDDETYTKTVQITRLAAFDEVRTLKSVDAVYTGKTLTEGEAVDVNDISVIPVYSVTQEDGSEITETGEEISSENIAVISDPMKAGRNMVRISVKAGDETITKSLAIVRNAASTAPAGPSEEESQEEGEDENVVEVSREFLSADVSYTGRELSAGEAVNTKDISIIPTYMVSYSDGSTKTVTGEKIPSSAITITSDEMAVGDNEVTFTFTVDGKKQAASITITRSAVKIVSQKLRYVRVKYVGNAIPVGEKVDPADISVIPTYLVKYSDGSSKSVVGSPVATDAITINNGIIRNVGTNIVTIVFSVNGSKQTQTVIVKGIEPESVDPREEDPVQDDDDTNVYETGREITDMEIDITDDVSVGEKPVKNVYPVYTVTYSDGSSKTVTGEALSDDEYTYTPERLEKGDNTVVVTCLINNLIKTVDIHVEASDDIPTPAPEINAPGDASDSDGNVSAPIEISEDLGNGVSVTHMDRLEYIGRKYSNNELLGIKVTYNGQTYTGNSVKLKIKGSKNVGKLTVWLKGINGVKGSNKAFKGLKPMSFIIDPLSVNADNIVGIKRDSKDRIKSVSVRMKDGKIRKIPRKSTYLGSDIISFSGNFTGVISLSELK